MAVVLLPSPAMHRPTRALITGSSGFIGSHLADDLTRLGHEVIGIDRRHRARAGHPQITADLNDPAITSRLAAATAWADVVFHLAARPGVRGEGPDVEQGRRRDIVGATEAVLTSVPPDTHLVVTSSSSVYGGSLRDGDGWRPSRESDPLRPAGSYAVRKVEMERLCREWASEGGSLSIVRPFTVIGERQRDDMAVSLWLDAVSAGRPVEVLGSVDRVRDMTDVRCVVGGLERIASERHLGVVNLGSGTPRTLGQVIEVVFAVVGREVPVRAIPAPAQEVEATCADIRIASDLGISLHTDLEGVVARQYAERAVRRLMSA